MIFVLLNETTGAGGLVAQVTPKWLGLVAAACTKQLCRDVCPAWGLSAAAPVSVLVGAVGGALPPGSRLFTIVDSLPNAPGAVAYHDVDGNGLPVAFLALSTCASLDDVSVAISHEVCETAGDPACNRWCDDGNGREFALELCDAVESARYGLDGVAVSDFLLPDFFDPQAAGPYSHLGVPKAPFLTAPGGYQIVRNAGGGETQVLGRASPARHTAMSWGFGRSAKRLGKV